MSKPPMWAISPRSRHSLCAPNNIERRPRRVTSAGAWWPAPPKPGSGASRESPYLLAGYAPCRPPLRAPLRAASAHRLPTSSAVPPRDEALYVLEGQIRIRQGTTSSSPAPARVSGGHGECRTPSRWSPKARLHLSSSRPEASSGCSRRAACRPASQPTHPARSTSRRRRSRWRRGLGSRSSDRSSHSSAWLLGLWRSTWRSPSWRSLSAGSRLRGAAGRAGSGR